MPTSLWEEPLFGWVWQELLPLAASLDGLVWHELPPLAVRQWEEVDSRHPAAGSRTPSPPTASRLQKWDWIKVKIVLQYKVKINRKSREDKCQFWVLRIQATGIQISVPNPWHYGTDPDPHRGLTHTDPDPALNVSDFKTPIKNICFLVFFCLYFLKVHLNHSSKIKSQREVIKE